MKFTRVYCVNTCYVANFSIKFDELLINWWMVGKLLLHSLKLKRLIINRVNTSIHPWIKLDCLLTLNQFPSWFFIQNRNSMSFPRIFKFFIQFDPHTEPESKCLIFRPLKHLYLIYWGNNVTIINDGRIFSIL